MDRQPAVYILTNKTNTVLYIGVTSHLASRVLQHRDKEVSGFTQQYNTIKLVYYELLDRMDEAIIREKQLKNWHRQWKINLIEKYNPDWKDLSNDF